MVSLKTPQGVLWILFIRLYTSKKLFGANDKNTKITRSCVQIPPRAMAKLALQIKYDPNIRKEYGNEYQTSINSFNHVY